MHHVTVISNKWRQVEVVVSHDYRCCPRDFFRVVPAVLDPKLLALRLHQRTLRSRLVFAAKPLRDTHCRLLHSPVQECSVFYRIGYRRLRLLDVMLVNMTYKRHGTRLGELLMRHHPQHAFRIRHCIFLHLCNLNQCIDLPSFIRC